MKTKILLLFLLLATGSAIAQQDSLRKVNISGQAPGETSESRWSVGGYGEMLAAFKDYGLNRYYGGNGNTRKNRSEISILRFVLSGEYKITPKWILTAEIEFESGGTGVAYELESGTGSEKGGLVTTISASFSNCL